MKTIKLLLITVALFSGAIAAAATDNKSFLGDRHEKVYGVTCDQCHSENPPAKPVNTETCLSCHESLRVIGEKTNYKKLPNPHVNHNEELYCEDCHHAHKAPEIYCNQCHEFNYKFR